jgi:hydrogenase nickel incorporation protein HypB
LAFNTSHVVLITKSDIARAVGYDRSAATASIRQVNPVAQILEISVRSDTGVDAWIELLERRMREKSLAPAR